MQPLSTISHSSSPSSARQNLTMKTLSYIFTLLFLSVSISPALARETKGFSPDKQIVYKTVGETEL